MTEGLDTRAHDLAREIHGNAYGNRSKNAFEGIVAKLQQGDAIDRHQRLHIVIAGENDLAIPAEDGATILGQVFGQAGCITKAAKEDHFTITQACHVSYFSIIGIEDTNAAR
jgi:hypothetical protein